MNFRLVEISGISGEKCRIYSVLPDGEQYTVFEQFLTEYENTYADDIDEIYNRLHVMGHREGARDGYFKKEEGRPGDLVCALYDKPDEHLRLYCIRFGTVAIILGGGGPKTKDIRAWQEDRVLSENACMMMAVSSQYAHAVREGDIAISPTGELIGNLNFIDDNEIDDYE